MPDLVKIDTKVIRSWEGEEVLTPLPLPPPSPHSAIVSLKDTNYKKDNMQNILLCRSNIIVILHIDTRNTLNILNVLC